MKEVLRRLRTSLSREVLLDLVFGVLTTVVNYVVFIGLNAIFGEKTVVWSGVVLLLGHSWPVRLEFWTLSNVVAFVVAVTFAFLTNRDIVFKAVVRTGDRAKDRAVAFRQGVLFWCARLATLAMESAILWLFIDLLDVSYLLSKIVSNVFVVIGNYFLSKFIVFPVRPVADGKV